MTYTYDSWGNLTAKSVYAYTTATDPGTPISTISYGYSTGDWKDQLVSYGNQTIAYDAMGNPTTYRGKTLTWRGKQLTGIAVGTDMIAYSYDENGLRLQKTVNDVVTDYYYNGKVLIGLVKGNDTLRFSYDAAGLAQAVNFNGTYYYYLRNGQGDIVKIIDGSGNTVVEYSCDSWGRQLSCTGTLATTLGAVNPFRYRGYVYDEETQWYYLKSRYYDPETCRFISADVLLSTDQGVIGHNCFVYCLNSPVNCVDDEGEKARLVAIGIQLQVTIGDYQMGVEVVWYFDNNIRSFSRSSFEIYTYAGVSISLGELLADPNITKTIEAINTMVFSPSKIKRDLTSLYDRLSCDLGGSISVFAIMGYENFKTPSDYCGTFQTVGASTTHLQGYYSWSDTCFVIGVGVRKTFIGSDLLPIDGSFGISEYVRLTE